LEVARVKPGEPVQMKILRDNSTKTLTVRPDELPGSEKVAQTDSQGRDNNEALKGVAVTDLDARTRREFKVPVEVQGALIAEVADDSAASEAGIKAGDVILEINRQAVRSAEDAVKLTTNPKDKTTLLRIWSGGSRRYVVVDESNAG
jgi:serine protease Do